MAISGPTNDGDPDLSSARVCPATSDPPAGASMNPSSNRTLAAHASRSNSSASVPPLTQSPRALFIAFVVVAAACSLVSRAPSPYPGTARPRRVRACFVATSALVGGTVAVALVGSRLSSGSVSDYSPSSSW